jgi:hypothetical protein
LYDISIQLPDVRLNKRYLGMVKGHLQQATTTATGISVPASAENPFAITQASWRFLDNDRVTPLGLVEPLRHFAQQQLAGAGYTLAVIDWSKLDYRKHTAKKDIVQLTHKHDVGYELTSHLLVNAQNGNPIAPIQVHLKTLNGYLSTAETVPAADDHHLAQVLPLMQDAGAMEMPSTLVHVIDREADSVFHLREWSAAGFLFLVRGDDRWVHWRGELVKYSTIEKRLETEGAFRPSREVSIKGDARRSIRCRNKHRFGSSCDTQCGWSSDIYSRRGSCVAVGHCTCGRPKVWGDIEYVVFADKCSFGSSCGTDCVMVLLAMGDREFFQVIEERRSAVGALATGVWRGGAEAVVSGFDGVCVGMEFAKER